MMAQDEQIKYIKSNNGLETVNEGKTLRNIKEDLEKKRNIQNTIQSALMQFAGMVY